MSRVKRVLLVDDHEMVREGLVSLIDTEPDLQVCGSAADAPEALRLLTDTQPHIAIVDLMLEDGSGLQLIRRMKAVDETLRVLVYSMHDDMLYAERALESGAAGYVNKQQPATKVIEAVREVLAGGVAIDKRVADRVLLRRVSRGASKGSGIEGLSDRELEVLQLIGAGKSTREVAESLHLSVKTIDTYRENLKRKLGLESANELLRFAVAWSLSPDGRVQDSQ